MLSQHTLRQSQHEILRPVGERDRTATAAATFILRPDPTAYRQHITERFYGTVQQRIVGSSLLSKPASWIITGVLVPVQPAVAASAGRDGDDR
jgi:hypothetical protein